jgi:phosphatidylglycerol---prolipoprotein diacylglyceryl transferase
LLSLLQAAASSVQPIFWDDLGLTPGISLGFFTLRWYSLAYLAGIVFAYWHTVKAIKLAGAPMAERHCDDLFFYCTLGVILGGRFGYATFYAPELWLQPLELLKLWNGGMSFHGGLIGVVLAFAWVSWRGGLKFLRVADYVAVSVPMGMLLGRLANFVNGELWGRVAGEGFAWAMVFPAAPDQLPRHPSQLYEAALEGALVLVLLLLLFWKTNARFRPGLLMGTFAAGLGIGRFIVEYFREPDRHLEYVVVQTGLSMGQWLTVPLIAGALFFVIRALLRPPLGSGGEAKA